MKAVRPSVRSSERITVPIASSVIAFRVSSSAEPMIWRKSSSSERCFDRKS